MIHRYPTLLGATLAILCLHAQAQAASPSHPVWFSTSNCLAGGPIPPTPGTLIGNFPSNIQAGTTYTVVTGDQCSLLEFTNAAAVAVSLPSPALPANWMAFFEARGAGGTTITPAAGTIETLASLTLPKNNGAAIFSDGTNYHVFGTVIGSGAGQVAVAVRCEDLTDFGTACLANTGTSGTTLGFLNTDNQWSAHQEVEPVVLTDGATITPSGTDANAYTLTIAGNNHTLAAPSTTRFGVYAFRFLNSGGVTGFATSSAYKFAGGTQPTWTTTTGHYDVMTCHVFDTSRLECAALTDVK